MKKFLHSFKTLIYCVLEVIIGILILIDPMLFTTSIIRLLGIVLTVIGVLSVMRYFKMTPELGSMSLSFVKGLIMIVAGVFCIFDPGWFSKAFTVITIAYGVVILCIGLFKLQWSVDAVRLGLPHWLLSGIGGLTSIVFAVIIILNPFTAIEMVWIFIGIVLIIEGVLDGVIAFTESRQSSNDSGYRVEILDEDDE